MDPFLDAYFHYGGCGHIRSIKIEPNKWYHVVLLRRGGTGQLYINGEMVAEVVASKCTCQPDGDLFFGKDHFSRENFRGIIDEVRIYNRALSVSEIKELYKKK